MANTMNRRKFLTGTSLSAAGLVLGSKPGAEEAFKKSPASYDMMKDVMKYRKIDSHVHLYFTPNTIEDQLGYADRLGIEKLSISRPVTTNTGTQDEVIKCNNLIIEAVRKHPDRFIGFFTLIPTYVKESVEEMKRCVDAGMAGYKGYLQVKVNDKSYYPVIEKLIELKMICFMHAYSGLGRGGYKTKYGNLYPNETVPEDMAEIAKRYPEAIFHWSHIGAGGDWQYQCKALQDYPNVYVDTSGSNNEANMVNYALEYLGEDRLFYGSDSSYYQSVSNILSSDLTESQRKKIFFDNYNNLLRKGGFNVD